jgi:hypothetical protein
MDESSLLVTTDDRVPLRVSRQAMTRLEISTGRRRKAVKGMIIGAGIGAVIFQTSVSDNCDGAVNVCTESHAAAAGLGLVAGAAWGAGIGALFKGDRWSAVPLDRANLSVAPIMGRGRLGLSLSVGW